MRPLLLIKFITLLSIGIFVSSLVHWTRYQVPTTKECGTVVDKVKVIAMDDIVAYDINDQPILRKECHLAGRLKVHQRFLVVGIPSVVRTYQGETAYYLGDTLRSFLDPLSPKLKEQILLLVFLTDTNITRRQEHLERTKSLFPHELESGMLNLVQVPLRYYPNISEVPRSLGDSRSKVTWRTQLTLDFSFLHAYAYNMGKVFMQSDDDALVRDDIKYDVPGQNYLDVIKRDLTYTNVTRTYRECVYCIEKIERPVVPWKKRPEPFTFIRYKEYSGTIGIMNLNEHISFAHYMYRYFSWSMPADYMVQGYKRIGGFQFYEGQVMFKHIAKLSSIKERITE